jgi:hypothetical protein
MQKTIQIRIIHKNLRAYEIQQRKQLLQTILQRGPSDQQPAPRYKRPHDLGQQRIDVLDAVRLVDDDILETELLEGRFLDEADLVGCDADFEVLRDEAVRDDVRALFFCAC